MRLLLTSAGITNKSIEAVFQKMVEKPFNEVLVAFIPTASNLVAEDKWWVIKDLLKLRDLGCKTDIVDISAMSKDHWLPRLHKADVIFVEGGDTFYLMEQIHKTGLYNEIQELLKTKVWVGVSAGSSICAKNLALKASQFMYDEGLDRKEDIVGFNFVPFYIFPHFNNDLYFPKVTKDNLEKFSSIYNTDMYLIDDMTAVSINDNLIEVISEGKWKKISV